MTEKIFLFDTFFFNPGLTMRSRGALLKFGYLPGALLTSGLLKDSSGAKF